MRGKSSSHLSIIPKKKGKRERRHNLSLTFFLGQRGEGTGESQALLLQGKEDKTNSPWIPRKGKERRKREKKKKGRGG